jgi:hypothetical protein
MQCGQRVQLLGVKPLVHHVTRRLYKIKEISHHGSGGKSQFILIYSYVRVLSLIQKRGQSASSEMLYWREFIDLREQSTFCCQLIRSLALTWLRFVVVK